MDLQRFFFDYKSQFVKDVVQSEKLVKLINPNVPFEDAKSLIYTQIFPHEYLPETAETSLTYVCCEVDVLNSEVKTFLHPVLYVWVFTHASNLRLPEGGVRTDAICSEICSRINGSRYYGLGELRLYAVKRFAPLTDLNGKVMIFHAEDFNTQTNPSRPTPRNRRLGI